MSRFVSKSTEDDIIKILAKSSHPVDKTVDSMKKKMMSSQTETLMKMAPKATNSIKRGHGLQVNPAPRGYGLQVDAAPGYGYGLQVDAAPGYGYGFMLPNRWGLGLQVGSGAHDTISGRGIIDPRKGNDLYSNNYM
jgi:hypothetical protein